MRNFKKQTGQSMIEFAIVLPIFFVLLLAMFEWSQIFIKSIRASTVSREIAFMAHEECKRIDPLVVNPETETIPACLARVCTEMVTRLNVAPTVFPNFTADGTLIVSLYNSAGGAGTASAVCGSTTHATHVTRFTAANINAGGLLTSAGILSVGEFFYENDMLTPLENLFSFVMPRLIYKATVI